LAEQIKKLSIDATYGAQSVQSLEAKIVKLGGDPAQFKPLLDAYGQVRAAKLLADAEFTKSGKIMTEYGMGVKATSAALRQVPAQFTDIIVSLQGGQAPLTVLLQQGGQLKDVFGGVGNAFKALSGYVLGLINPFTIAAAAVGGLAYAYTKGAAEAEAYNKSLILTGNYAGTTAQSLSNMAQAISQTTGGTVGGAAASLAALAANGTIAASQFDKLAVAATQMQKSTGAAVADTVKQFAELAKEPLSASIKLNEATNYLTSSVYEQIKSLTEQGRVLEAGVVAQNAWADAISNRTPQIVENLGYVEKAWKAIANEAKGAMDWAFGIGREPDPVEILRKQISVREGFIRDKYTQAVPTDDATLNGLRQQLSYLQETDRMAKRLAESQAASAAGVKAQVEFGKERDKYLSKQVQMEREIAAVREKYNNQRPEDRNPAELAAAIQGIQEKFKETAKAQSEASKGLALYNDLMATSVKVSANFTEDQSKLTAAYGAGAISLEQYQAAMTALVAKQPYMVANLKAEADAVREAGKAYEDSAKTAIKYYERMAKDNATLEKSNASLRAEVDAIGQSAAAKQLLAEARSNAAIAAAEENLALMNLQNSSEMEIQQATRQVELLREQASLRRQGVVNNEANDLAKANKKAAEESSKYWEDALMRAFESGKGFFQSLWDTIKNTLKTQVLKVMVSATGLTGMSAAGASTLSTAGDAAGIAGFGSNLISGLGLAATGFGQAAAATFSNGLIAGFSTNMANVGALASGGSWMTALGAAAPYLAIGAAVIGLISGNKKTPTQGTGEASLTYDSGGNLIGSDLGRPGNGGLSQLANGVIASMSASYFATAKQLGITAAEATFGFGGNTGKDSKGANFALWSSANGTSYSGSNNNSQSYTQEQLQLEASRAVFTALQSSKMPQYIARVFDGVTASILTQEQLDATLSRALAFKANLTTTNATLATLKLRLLDVSISGSDAANSLVDAFGSLDNLAASSKAYYEAFYTESERTADSAKNLADAMALVGVAIPESKQAFRDVVSGLDLTTESGRNAYAVLLTLAPEFAATTDAIDKMAAETATALLKTFTGDSQLIPALDAAALSIGNVASGATTMSEGLSYINLIMGDASSGVITLGGSMTVLGDGMTASQTSAELLIDQIAALGVAADGSVIDFDSLSTALLGIDPSLVGASIEDANRYLSGIDTLPVGASVEQINAALGGVNTETFVATVTLVFENLAERIGGVIDNITSERIAVREAALQIINPTVMTKDAIARSIASINTGLPSNAGVVAANATLATADQSLSWVKSDYDYRAANTPSTASVDTALATLSAANAAVVAADAAIAANSYISAEFNRLMAAGAAGVNPDAYAAQYGYSSAVAIGYDRYTAGQSVAPAQQGYDAALASYNAQYLEYTADIDAAALVVASYTTAQTTASAAAKKAALDYANALQTFAIDAGKSVTKLSRLREETVKYYDAQKALAELMGTSAAGLRKTVADYRYGTLSDADQLAQLKTQFSTAYSTALATQGDGATLAGYGDRLNGLLGPLIDKLNATGQENLIANYLAQAEAVAGLIEAGTPVNYQQDSLALLGSIDATLAALDASSQSAEFIISGAVKAGSDRTADGLRAVIAALTGQTIPAFASGGAYGGGVALVGEDGPELINFNQPGQVFNANQTQGMFSGNAELVAEVRALRSEVSNLRIEARATAISTAKIAKQGDRVEVEGMLTRTE
jgi:hypothetical protein